MIRCENLPVLDHYSENSILRLRLCCCSFECVSVCERLLCSFVGADVAVPGLTQEGLFRVNGNVKVVERLRWQLESGAPVELGTDGDVSSAASLLKLFLRELPERVITSALHPRFIQLFQGQYTASPPGPKAVLLSATTKLLNFKY